MKDCGIHDCGIHGCKRFGQRPRIGLWLHNLIFHFRQMSTAGYADPKPDATYDGLIEAAGMLANSATGSGEEGFSRVPNELLWKLTGQIERTAKASARERTQWAAYILGLAVPKSTLDALLRSYLLSKGFHPTAQDGSDEYGWGHPELGQGRSFFGCVEWQIGRERAEAAE